MASWVSGLLLGNLLFLGGLDSRTASRQREEKQRCLLPSPACCTANRDPIVWHLTWSIGFSTVLPGKQREVGRERNMFLSHPPPRLTPNRRLTESHHEHNCFAGRSLWLRTVLPDTFSEALTSHPSDSHGAKTSKKDSARRPVEKRATDLL